MFTKKNEFKERAVIPLLKTVREWAKEVCCLNLYRKMSYHLQDLMGNEALRVALHVYAGYVKTLHLLGVTSSPNV